MPDHVQRILLAGATLVFPFLGLLWRRRPGHVLALVGLGLVGLGAVALAGAWDPEWLTQLHVGLAAVVALLTILPPQRSGLEATLAILRRRRFLRGLLLAAGTIVCLVGLPEVVVRFLVASGRMEVEEPIRVVFNPQTSDWRLAHILTPESEPDPLLLWRPPARPPYNAQHFKGPVVAVPKPKDVFRVMCYGDSFTDGPADGGWPVRLAAAITAAGYTGKVEAVNAGVAGYSSHQGLLRFRSEVETYTPDLILVSYGWNDVATATDRADKDMRPPPGPLLALQRGLLRLQWYLALRSFLRGYAPPPMEVGPRVALPDYLANLTGFIDTARARGIHVLLLTRAFRYTPEEIAQQSGWRRQVGEYNEAVRALAAEKGVPLIDAYALLIDRQDLYGDECHVNPNGHDFVAAEVAKRIVALVGTTPR